MSLREFKQEMTQNISQMFVQIANRQTERYLL